MRPFTPKSVIYPAAGRNEILVTGTVPDEDGDGVEELRNVTITNREIAAQYRTVDEVCMQAQKQAAEARIAARAELDEQVFALALEKYTKDNTPRPVEEGE